MPRPKGPFTKIVNRIFSHLGKKPMKDEPDEMPETSIDTNLKGISTPMKKQGYNARLDESMGARSGKKKQSLKSRRKESEGMEKAMGKKKYSADKSMKKR